MPGLTGASSPSGALSGSAGLQPQALPGLLAVAPGFGAIVTQAAIMPAEFAVRQWSPQLIVLGVN